MRALRTIALSFMLALVATPGSSQAAGPAPAPTTAPTSTPSTARPVATTAPSPAPAPAPTTSPADAAAAALARRYYEDGVAAADAKEWQKAQLAFAEAWRLKQHWQIAVNLGQAELKLGKYTEAAEHLAYYLREATELHPDDVKQAGAWLDQAKSKIGILRLNVAPKGAQIFVDGKLVGTAPLARETYVETGWHAVEARSGDAKILRQVDAPMGQTVEVRLGVGGAVPPPWPEGTPGSGGSRSDGPTTVTPRLAIAIGGGAFTLVNLIVGGATAAVSAAKAGEQNRLCGSSCPQSTTAFTTWTTLEADRVSNANASVAGFVLAGLAAAGTVTAYVLLKPKPAAKAPAPPVTSLRISPTAGGIVLSGAF